MAITMNMLIGIGDMRYRSPTETLKMHNISQISAHKLLASCTSRAVHKQAMYIFIRVTIRLHVQRFILACLFNKLGFWSGCIWRVT
jgi:hypothetical protein